MASSKASGSADTTDLVVIGAGPAGMMAAFTAARSGARVTVCEQLERPGSKLLVTGGGRCNLTNVLDYRKFLEKFGKTGKFMHTAVQSFTPQDLCRFFDSLGVPTHCTDGFHVFPVSESATHVQNALFSACRSEGVRFRFRCRVKSLKITNGDFVGVQADQQFFEAHACLIATGGRSYSSLGATGSGYDLARQVGHQVVTPVPALVPLTTRENWPGDCAGAVVAPVKIWIDQKKLSRIVHEGELLFTHDGLSGPAALNISGIVSRLLLEQPGVPIRVSLLPDTSEDDWAERFIQWQEVSGRKMIKSLLDAYLPLSVARGICTSAGIAPDANMSQITKAQRHRLAEYLTRLPLTITSTAGFSKAIVTAGGISLREVQPRTLESRLVNGLYFAGEVLDVDGPCGGYNLQWAFSSGRLAGASAAEAASRELETA